MSSGQASLWAIILAGGEGERVKEFARERCGSAIPKQFCAFVGRRSMLERTIRRAQLLIPSERLVVIGTAHHDSYMLQSLGTSPPGTVLFQPANRDTAPGILLPLIHILRKDPQARVVIMPADHFVVPGYRFMRTVAMAAHVVEDQDCDSPILLAVKPDRPEPEYGWIQPGNCVSHGSQASIRRIEQFIEKPPRDRAEQLMMDGWLWNTMVIVARAQALMDLAWEHMPGLARWFSLLQRFWGGVHEQDYVEEVYRFIPKTNFSTSLLAARHMQSFVLPVQDIYWSDWGTKERILDTVSAFGLRLAPSIQTPHASITSLF
ncbi:MAG: sugar phosphate nucleotidyltransferase [Nitrospira sp.]